MDAVQLCTFRVDTLLCGLDVTQVQEVVRAPEITPVPLAPPVVRGLVNLRGEIVPAIDLRRRLELAERPADRVPMSVVLRTPDGIVGLLVDDIGDVVEVVRDAYEPAPETLRGVARDVIAGAYKLKAGLVLVLDGERAATCGGDAG